MSLTLKDNLGDLPALLGDAFSGSINGVETFGLSLVVAFAAFGVLLLAVGVPPGVPFLIASRISSLSGSIMPKRNTSISIYNNNVQLIIFPNNIK